MGQYFQLVNYTKKEYIEPHQLGSGIKLIEISKGLPALWNFLLRKSDEVGAGGDVKENYKGLGRWSGDSVALVGDYSEEGFKKETEWTNVKGDYSEEGIKEETEWTNVTEKIIDGYRKFLRNFLDVKGKLNLRAN